VWWLTPGLLVKRWLFLSVVGVVLLGIGAANLAETLTPVFYTGQLVGAAPADVYHLCAQLRQRPLGIFTRG
jgi:hypothetical protein